MISAELLIVLVAATFSALLFERFRLPALLGFILAGTVIGPHCLGWVADSERIHNLAEIGMIFLMLTIGLEFSFDRLRGMKKAAFFGGAAQLVLSIAVCIVAAMAMGHSLYLGFVLGAVIALSSTAIIFRNLADRGQLDTEHGRLCIAILVFQDLAVGPLLIFINAFGGSNVEVIAALLSALVKAGILMAVILLFSRYLLSPMMRWISHSKSREIFMLSTVLLCFGMSWLSAKLGLSASLGAFFAGLMLANTDYHSQILGDIAPFRHVFISIFFVSIGLLFDPVFSVTNLQAVLPVSGLILFVNIVIMAVVLVAVGYSPRVAVTAGVVLSQIGEFSFLLLENARHGKLIDDFFYQNILSAAVLTILLTPFLINVIPLITRIFSRLPFFGLAPQPKEAIEKAHHLNDHIILCGYGTAGQDLAAAMLLEKIPFVVVEMNPVNIARARKHGVPVIYGDAMNQAVLHEVSIEKAKGVVISFGDASGLAILIPLMKSMNPQALIVVRTRYERDISRLYELGADLVIMEELEVSAELTRVILGRFDRQKEIIETHIDRIKLRKGFLVEQSAFKKSK